MQKTENVSEKSLKQVKETTVSKTVEIKTFRAKITASKPHYMQKVISHRATIKDAFNYRFCSDAVVFIPKLTTKYQKPCVMINAKNGSSSTLIRSKSPIQLALWLEDLAQSLRSDAFLDLWDETVSISEKLICGDENVVLDDQFLDVQDFKEAFIEHGREMCNYAKNE